MQDQRDVGPFLPPGSGPVLLSPQLLSSTSLLFPSSPCPLESQAGHGIPPWLVSGCLHLCEPLWPVPALKALQTASQGCCLFPSGPLIPAPAQDHRGLLVGATDTHSALLSSKGIWKGILKSLQNFQKALRCGNESLGNQSIESGWWGAASTTKARLGGHSESPSILCCGHWFPRVLSAAPSPEVVLLYSSFLATRVQTPTSECTPVVPLATPPLLARLHTEHLASQRFGQGVLGAGWMHWTPSSCSLCLPLLPLPSGPLEIVTWTPLHCINQAPLPWHLVQFSQIKIQQEMGGRWGEKLASHWPC